MVDALDRGSPESATRRADFRAAVAELVEPVRTVLTAADAEGLLSATGWRAEVSPGSAGDPTRRAGFVVAATA